VLALNTASLASWETISDVNIKTNPTKIAYFQDCSGNVATSGTNYWWVGGPLPQTNGSLLGEFPYIVGGNGCYV
jgi:hypothetical protein